MTTAEILARAADLIEPEGAWTQDDLLPEGTLCPLLAICRAGASSPESNDVYHARMAFRAHIKAESIVEWNADPGHTQQEVVAALRLASARAKEEK